MSEESGTVRAEFLPRLTEVLSSCLGEETIRAEAAKRFGDVNGEVIFTSQRAEARLRHQVAVRDLRAVECTKSFSYLHHLQGSGVNHCIQLAGLTRNASFIRKLFVEGNAEGFLKAFSRSDLRSAIEISREIDEKWPIGFSIEMDKPLKGVVAEGSACLKLWTESLGEPMSNIVSCITATTTSPPPKDAELRDARISTFACIVDWKSRNE